MHKDSENFAVCLGCGYAPLQVCVLAVLSDESGPGNEGVQATVTLGQLRQLLQFFVWPEGRIGQCPLSHPRSHLLSLGIPVVTKDGPWGNHQCHVCPNLKVQGHDALMNKLWPTGVEAGGSIFLHSSLWLDSLDLQSLLRVCIADSFCCTAETNTTL